MPLFAGELPAGDVAEYRGPISAEHNRRFFTELGDRPVKRLRIRSGGGEVEAFEALPDTPIAIPWANARQMACDSLVGAARSPPMIQMMFVRSRYRRPTNSPYCWAFSTLKMPSTIPLAQ